MVERLGTFRPWVKKVMPTVYDDTLTYYEIVSKTIGYLNQVIDQGNEIVEYVDEIKDTGNNNFENLSKEVRDKLQRQFGTIDDNNMIQLDLIDSYHRTQLSEMKRMRVDFEEAKLWVENEALPDSVAEKLDVWLESGKLADVINNDVFDMKANQEDLVNVEKQVDTTAKKTAGTISVNEYQHLVPNKNDPRSDWDWTIAVETMLSEVPDGSTILFPDALYKMKRPMYITKFLIIKGNGLYVKKGSTLEFDGCDGIIDQKGYLNLERISLDGINKHGSSVVDIPNKFYGTIGLKMEYKDDVTSGGSRTHNVFVRGFNVGLSMIAEGTATWSGAYREFTNLVLVYNDIGVLALNGATHNKFYGGIINKNELHGIYSDSPAKHYNELEFVGTTIEGNGYYGTYSTGDYTKFGVYSGKESKVKFTNAYFENMALFADVGGSIVLTSCHIHTDTKMFAKGSIVERGGTAPYEIKKTFNGSLFDRLTFTDCTGSNLSSTNNRVKVTSDIKGSPRIVTSNVNLRSVVADSIKRIKLTFRYKVNSGLTAEGFGLQPTITLTGSGTDGTNVDLAYPRALFKPTKKGEYQKMEFSWLPRKGSGYIDPNQLLTGMTATIRFYLSGTADFTKENLDIEILNPTFTIYSDEDFGLMDENINTLTTDVALKANKSQGTTVEVDLENGWTGKLSFSKNDLGQVWMRGIVTAGQMTSSSKAICVIPSEFRPSSHSTDFNLYSSTTTTISAGGLVVKSSGQVLILSPAHENIQPNESVRIDKIYQA